MSTDILKPYHALAFLFASSSIASLLVYFLGWASMVRACVLLLLPSIPLLLLLSFWAERSGRRELNGRLVTGLWAGSFATLAYDLVRVPLAHRGVPVFKAISYFGTVLLDVPSPTLASEVVGWGYHFSNGIGFALMYVLLVSRPTLVTAVVWGLLLEGLMLLTPYAEIFGYARSTSFLVISITGHVFYGIGLYLACRYLTGRGSASFDSAGAFRWRGSHLVAWLAGPLCLALIAADFHRLHATTIPTSPPSDLGPGLYVTWNVPEPDRIGSIWLMTRFAAPGARFHFIAPMSRVLYGTPFDLPEAEIRRSYGLSTFEVLLKKIGKDEEKPMVPLARMCHNSEIRPWVVPSTKEERELAAELAARLGECREIGDCLDRGLAWFDEAYARLGGESR